MMAQLPALQQCSLLSPPQRLLAAELASLAMDPLYDSLGPQLLSMLASEFNVNGSELGNAVALMSAAVDGVVDGIVASYPANEYSGRQRVSLHHALSNLDREAGARLITRLRSLAPVIPQGIPDSEYISRVAVRQHLRGTGAADRLMDLFLAGRPVVSLHVGVDNDRAISFYRRHDFVERCRSTKFILMLRG